jgi:acetyltransferase-like isoleucine patch superfamily enzyme
MQAERQIGIKRIMRKLLLLFLNFPLVSGYKRAKLYKLMGVNILDTSSTFIGRNVEIDDLYPELVTIGKGCLITSGTKIMTHYLDTTSLPPNKFITGSVKIGDYVFIGLNTLIVKSCTIGDNSVIAAGSVVISDIEENAIYGGVPAKKIGIREIHSR